MDVPWDIFWQSQPYRARSAILDDKRDALAMPMQRDAMRTGRRPDLNTEDQAIVAQAGKDLGQLTDIAQRQGRDHRLPDAARGQDLAPPVVVGRPPRRRVLLHAEGRAAERALVLEPRRERRRPERLLLHRPHGEEPGARAPVRRTSCSTRRTPTRTSSTSSATRRRRRTSTPSSLIKSGLIPKSLTRAVVRPDQFPLNQELLQLSVAGEQYWDEAWSKFKAG